MFCVVSLFSVYNSFFQAVAIEFVFFPDSACTCGQVRCCIRIGGGYSKYSTVAV